jgi:hypothetical protein
MSEIRKQIARHQEQVARHRLATALADAREEISEQRAGAGVLSRYALADLESVIGVVIEAARRLPEVKDEMDGAALRALESWQLDLARGLTEGEIHRPWWIPRGSTSYSRPAAGYWISRIACADNDCDWFADIGRGELPPDACPSCGQSKRKDDR